MNEAPHMNTAPQRIQETLDGSQMFRDFEQDGFRLRTAPASLDGLYCVTAAGNCLDPVIIEGDRVYVERGAVPEHGDLALIEWAPAVVEAWFASERAESWAKRFGNLPMNRGLKLAWDFPQYAPERARSRYYICRENASKRATPLGTVRAVERGGVLLRGDLVHRPVGLAGIDAHAATSTSLAVQSSISSPPINPYPAAPTDVFTTSISALSIDCTIIITLVISNAYISTGAAQQVGITAGFYDGAASEVFGPNPALVNAVTSATASSYSYQAQFQHLRSNGLTVTGALSLVNLGSTSALLQANGTISLQVEAIVR